MSPPWRVDTNTEINYRKSVNIYLSSFKLRFLNILFSHLTDFNELTTNFTLLYFNGIEFQISNLVFGKKFSSEIRENSHVAFRHEIPPFLQGGLFKCECCSFQEKTEEQRQN
jgi:hypothetical protein